jgi:cytochrome c oxidase cbb3-type subunit 3
MKTAIHNHKKKNNTLIKSAFLLILTSIISIEMNGQVINKVEPTSSLFSNAVFMALVSVIIVLLVVIYVFSEMLKAAAQHKKDQLKGEKEKSLGAIKTVLLFIVFSTTTNSLTAQNADITVGQDLSYWGISPSLFYLLISIIIVEVAVAWSLYKISMQLLGVEERKLREAKLKPKSEVKKPTIIDKLNASVSIEKEKDIMLDHDYDGIKELDNDLPPWWKYGFYISIVFGVFYLIHFHIINTGKLQEAEYDEQILIGKMEADAYRKKAANFVDENNATVLTDNESIASGKSIYMDNCGACHGRAGEGGVGPNLTDNYWLHGGGIKDIFKTIKYGWPDKGMKAWQLDLGAKQIHEVSSFIKSLYGTNPPNAKEKQGVLFEETSATNDSLVINDSTAINKIDSTINTVSLK